MIAGEHDGRHINEGRDGYLESNECAAIIDNYAYDEAVYCLSSLRHESIDTTGGFRRSGNLDDADPNCYALMGRDADDMDAFLGCEVVEDYA